MNSRIGNLHGTAFVVRGCLLFLTVIVLASDVKGREAQHGDKEKAMRGDTMAVSNAMPEKVFFENKIGIRVAGHLFTPSDYYRTPRGQHPNWKNEMRMASMDAVMAYDAFYLVDTLLTQPLQVVTGDRPGAFGSVRDGRDLVERAASADKDLLVLEGASHFDLYDNPAYVDPAMARFAGFFNTHLK